MLQRSFSRREKALLLCLSLIILFAAYYFLIHQPCKEALALAQSEKQAIETENTALIAKCQKKDKMVKELEEILANPITQEVPKFDNIAAVTAYLDASLKKSLSYDIRCGNVKYESKNLIYRRPVDITCNLNSYKEARAIIEDIRSCPYLCHMLSIRITPDKDRGLLDAKQVEKGSLILSLTANFFEAK